MPMRFLATLFLVSALPATPAGAGSVADCKSLSDEDAVGECLAQEFETAEQRLSQAAGTLERALGKIDNVADRRIDAVSKFRDAHEAWTESRIKDCGFLGAIEGWGAQSPNFVLACLINETDRRSARYSGLADGLTQRYLE